LIGAQLDQSEFVAAQMKRVKVWNASPPQKTGLSWADLSGAIVDRPSEREARDVAGWLNEVHKASPPWSVPTAEGLPGTSPATTTNNGVWVQWREALTRSEGNASYRAAIMEVVTDFACNNSRFAIAVVHSLTHLDGGYIDIAGSRQKFPQTRSDPALASAPDGPAYDIVDTYTPYDHAIPIWFSPRELIESLRGPSCRAVHELNPDMLRPLDVWTESLPEEKRQ